VDAGDDTGSMKEYFLFQQQGTAVPITRRASGGVAGAATRFLHEKLSRLLEVMVDALCVKYQVKPLRSLYSSHPKTHSGRAKPSLTQHRSRNPLNNTSLSLSLSHSATACGAGAQLSARGGGAGAGDEAPQGQHAHGPSSATLAHPLHRTPRARSQELRAGTGVTLSAAAREKPPQGKHTQLPHARRVSVYSSREIV
jgi:hypothetical protein